jgi:hypothetical protein
MAGLFQKAYYFLNSIVIFNLQAHCVETSIWFSLILPGSQRQSNPILAICASNYGANFRVFSKIESGEAAFHFETAGSMMNEVFGSTS